MPTKKVILAEQATTLKVAKATKKKVQKPSSIAKKANHAKPKMVRKVVRKATPPQAPSYMKAPPKKQFSPPSTRSSAKRSARVPKPKKRD
jgi:hypothetical protein